MTDLAKTLLSVIITVIVSPAKIGLAQAITITNGSYEFESVDSDSGGVGLKNYRTRFIGLDNGPANVPSSEPLTHCDLDPQSCGAMTAPNTPHRAGITTAHDTVSSKGSTAAGATEFSEPTALLLLIVGLIGLSRLRGKPME